VELRGSVVTITGASSGIGRATAIAFAQEGALTVVAARRSAALDEVVAEIERLGGRGMAVPCDVGDWSQVERLATQVQDAFGRCDVLVNNAGARLSGRVSEVPIDEIDHVVRTNFLGVIYCTRAFYPLMLRTGRGHIVNVSPLAARIALPGDPVYTATKHAVTGFSEALGFASRPRGIRVTSFHPGWVSTEGMGPRREGRGRKVLQPHQVGQAIVDVVRSDKGPEVFLPRIPVTARVLRKLARKAHRFA
jgi:uncharacterized protein